MSPYQIHNNENPIPLMRAPFIDDVEVLMWLAYSFDMTYSSTERVLLRHCSTEFIKH